VSQRDVSILHKVAAQGAGTWLTRTRTRSAGTEQIDSSKLPACPGDDLVRQVSGCDPSRTVAPPNAQPESGHPGWRYKPCILRRRLLWHHGHRDDRAHCDRGALQRASNFHA
jgi:hypothetical protein